MRLPAKIVTRGCPKTKGSGNLSISAKSFAICADDKSKFKSYYGADNKFAP
jgi:hypothetical protein